MSLSGKEESWPRQDADIDVGAYNSRVMLTSPFMIQAMPTAPGRRMFYYLGSL